MKRKHILLTASFFILAIANCIGQSNIEFDDKNFTDRKAFKEANKHYEDGNDFFNDAKAREGASLKYFIGRFHYLPNGINELGSGSGAEEYRLALAEYVIANAFNPNSATLNYRIAVCYYNISSQRLMGLKYIEKAITLNPNVDITVQFYLGRLNHLHAQWDKAITAYRAYLAPLNTNPAENRDKIADMNRKIQECVSGKELQKNPQRVFIDNIGGVVNTSYPEFSPIITADESEMYFTSRRNTSTGAKLENGDFYEDLYRSTYISGAWSAPVNMGKPINSVDHDATAGLSPDGQKLYVYRPTNNGDLYECELKGSVWSEPERMNKNINSDDHESTVSLSFDGKKLFYISDKDGGIGHRDVWVSNMDVKGKWGPSTNIGLPINTIYGEEGVFIHPDGKTMYFSSQGHSTMGGYDIFKSELKDGKWGTPENLGWPINGPDDDVFFVISANGKHGYYASNKADGLGEKDIYKITFLGPDKPLALSSEDNLLAGLAQPVKNVEALQPVAVKTANVTILKGTVTDKLSHVPLGARIEIVDNGLNQTIATFYANSSSGKYLVTLPSGKNYGIYVKMDGYLFHSENFDIPVIATFQEVTKDIEMEKIAVGSTIVLRNVFFDYAKATLKPESSQELDLLVKILSDNPTIRIELSGHTDSRGSDEGNQKLSEARAKACVDYLVAHGIKLDRLEFKGYGEAKPIDTNETEPGMANNRRTEFKILSK